MSTCDDTPEWKYLDGRLDMWDGERNDIETARDANFRIAVTGTLTWAKDLGIWFCNYLALSRWTKEENIF